MYTVRREQTANQVVYGQAQLEAEVDLYITDSGDNSITQITVQTPEWGVDNLQVESLANQGFRITTRGNWERSTLCEALKHVVQYLETNCPECVVKESFS